MGEYVNKLIEIMPILNFLFILYIAAILEYRWIPAIKKLEKK